MVLLSAYFRLGGYGFYLKTTEMSFGFQACRRFYIFSIYDSAIFEIHNWSSQQGNSLQEIAIETILVWKNSVQGPFLLKLLFVGLKTMSPSIH